VETLSPTLQTFYADLVQQVHGATEKPGTIYTQTNKGAKYLYAKHSVGTGRRDVFIGQADDFAARTRADQIRAEQSNARLRRTIVRTLRDNRVPVPTRALGNVLDAMSDAGLFADAVLVGTAAYICYSPIIGMLLPSGSLMTQDADLATASLAIGSDSEIGTMLDILKRADETFVPVPTLTKGAPSSSFRSRQGFLVDLLTPQKRRTDTNPMPLNNLQAGAVPLQHLDWLIDEPVRAVALHGAGIPVRVPQPSKYAVHKLILAQKRRQNDRTKRGKDLLQARALIEALSETDPHALQDAMEGAFSMGIKGWKQPAQRSLKELNIDLDELA
jgi:hypothetical protein